MRKVFRQPFVGQLVTFHEQPSGRVYSATVEALYSQLFADLLVHRDERWGGDVYGRAAWKGMDKEHALVASTWDNQVEVPDA